MAFDSEPLVTLDNKRRLLEEAVAGGWRLVFQHDPVAAVGLVEEAADGRVHVRPWRPEG
jgi:hypothetical protein